MTKKRLVEIEVLFGDSLIARALLVPELIRMIAEYQAATTSPRPPMCIACPKPITYAPGLWVILEDSEAVGLSGVCDECAELPPDDLARAIANDGDGGRVIPPSQLDPQEGSA